MAITRESPTRILISFNLLRVSPLDAAPTLSPLFFLLLQARRAKFTAEYQRAHASFAL